MTDKLRKFLAKLNAQELARVKLVLLRIAAGELADLNVKTLSGRPGYIRVRVGRVRIICRRIDGRYEVIHIANRDERTYKDLIT